MVHASGYRCVEGSAEVVVALPRRPVDQVQAHVLEASILRPTRRRQCAPRGVPTIQHLQHVRRDRLHADGHARIAARTDRGEQVRIEGLRVGLGGHLGAGREPDRVVHRAQQGDELPPTEQRRSAAAHEDRPDRPARAGSRENRCGQVDLGERGIQPTLRG